MRHVFKDSTYCWVVWHRGKQPSEVLSVEGLYTNRELALNEASQANAEGLTPVKDRILFNILRVALPHLIDRHIGDA